MQKILIVATLCVVLLITAMPTYAAFGAVDPADYVTNVTIDGDTKTVVYQFNGFQPYCIDSRNNEVYSQGVIDTTKVVSTEGQVPISLFFYPFGNKFYVKLPIYSGTAIDVRDILPGATLQLSFSFLTKFVQVTNISSVTVTYNATAACYDSNGNYIRLATITKTSSDVPVDGSKTVGMALDLTIAPDVAYVALLSTYTIEAAGYDFVCEVTPQPVQMCVPINMIAEQSNLMGSVVDKLGDVEGALGDVNDNLGGVNDKLDHIGGVLDSTVDYDSSLSDFGSVAGDAGNAMDSAGDVISDAGSMVGGMMSNNVMINSLTGVSQLAGLMFSDDYKIRICGLSINPFEAWVVVGGGLALIGLIMAYIFRKRGGGGSGA